MEITDVKVIPVDDEKLKAFATVTLRNSTSTVSAPRFRACARMRRASATSSTSSTPTSRFSGPGWESACDFPFVRRMRFARSRSRR